MMNTKYDIADRIQKSTFITNTQMSNDKINKLLVNKKKQKIVKKKLLQYF